MSTAGLIFGSGIFVAAVVMFALHRKALLEAAFIEGKRAGIKLAVGIAKERGDVAAYMSPSNELRTGLVRAQMAHAIEMDLRRELSEVR